jgi:hypothetical protein
MAVIHWNPLNHLLHDRPRSPEQQPTGHNGYPAQFVGWFCDSPKDDCLLCQRGVCIQRLILAADGKYMRHGTFDI